MKGTKFRIVCFLLILGPAWLGPYGSNVDANAVNLQAQGDPRQQTRPEEILPIVEITWPRLGAEVSPIGFIVKGRVKNLLKSCKVVLLLDEHPVAGECSSQACMHTKQQGIAARPLLVHPGLVISHQCSIETCSFLPV
jgi:hypothetical protein